MMHDLRHLIHTMETAVATHNLGNPGAYRRWNHAGSGEQRRDTGLNPYGCADAANILYTIARFPSQAPERQAWITTLQSLQNPETGLYEEETHQPIHTTAHCIAALELFEARPVYGLKELEPLRQTHELSAFLNALDWRSNPWRESHRGAGVYAAMLLAGEVSAEWEERYFTWLWDETDPQTGLLRKGRIDAVEAGSARSLFPYLAGTFHYLFNMEYAHRPMRYPAALVDTCLLIYQSRDYPLGEQVSFAEVDWVYCLNRAVRQSGHRFAEARQALVDFAGRYIRFLMDLDPETDLDDLHEIFGVACCLAELQQAVPGLLRTQRPLRLVLDRRPFI
jgi:hypothetical protein